MGGWLSGGMRRGAARLAVLAVASAAMSVAAAGAATAAGSGGWTGSKLPLPAGASPNTFRPMAISCSSATQCAGGGGYITTSRDYSAALLTLSAKRWTNIRATLPTGAVASQFTPAALESVSCPSATACFAGGNYANARGYQPMLLAWAGKKWTATEAPLPRGANSNPDASVSGISCPSPQWCTAVGQYDAGQDQYGLILQRSKGKWTASRAPVPPGADAIGGLTAVSCPTVKLCFAGGWDRTDDGAVQQMLLLTWRKGKWADVKLALPRNAVASLYPETDAVACPTATRCVAVGSYEDAAGDLEGVLLGWAGRGWTAATAPLPAGADANPQTNLNTVACPDSSRCVAGGGYEGAANQPQGLLLTWSRNKWSAATSPAPGYDVHAISCPSATRCYALSAEAGGLELLTGP
jgi:hypothetical protein